MHDLEQNERGDGAWACIGGKIKMAIDFKI